MKKILLMITMLLSFTACATNLELRLVKKYENVHPEFVTYVDEFIQMSDGMITTKDFKYFTMGLRKYDDSSTVVGTCHYLVNEVDISVDWWNSYKTPSERLELVFHEFGHCILKRDHTQKPISSGFIQWLERLGFKLGLFTEKGYMYDGCPASFMHPYTVSDRCINKHFAFYIKELFHGDKAVNYVETRKHDIGYSENRCAEPRVVNNTETWNKRDEDTLNRAKNTCLSRYKSCLKTFVKKEQLNYYAICE